MRVTMGTVLPGTRTLSFAREGEERGEERRGWHASKNQGSGPELVTDEEEALQTERSRNVEHVLSTSFLTTTEAAPQ